MWCAALVLLLAGAPDDPPKPIAFDRVVIDDNFPGAYQVEVADVNGDRKPDIVAVGGGTCAWYENPSWKKRIISAPKDTPAIISSATADLDGDGKAEVAIAYDFEMNNPKRGKLLLAVQGKTVDDPWSFVKIADVPSIHRVRFEDPREGLTPRDEPRGGPAPLCLIAAPIFGPEAKPPTYDQDPATILGFALGDAPKAGRWKPYPLGSRPVIHAIQVVSGRAGHSLPLIFAADNTGVSFVLANLATEGEKSPVAPVVPGAPGPAPKRGASEVHIGRLKGAPFSFVATIEPWHGSQVVVWPLDADARRTPTFKGGPRTVIDDTLDEGHALWVADIDRDGTDEVFAGHRGKDHRVSVYRFNGRNWDRTVLDRDIAAQDLRGGDIDGDGRPDVVGVGGSTHNVIWYRPR